MGFSKFILSNFMRLVGKMDANRLLKKTPFQGVETACDIPYIADNNKYHLLDVYYPQNLNKPTPIIIDIHGGGWIYGTKEINKHYCMGLASAGFVVVNINYRLLQENGTFPNNIKDIFCALDWINENISSYNGDINNIFLTGDSAGAHLALMAMSILADKKLKDDLKISTTISFNAAALTCAVADLEKFLKRRIPLVKYLAVEFFGKDYKNNPYLKYATIKNNKIEDFPPLFLISGDGDFMASQMKDFANECAKRGVNYKFKYIYKKQQKNKLMHVYNILYPEWEESIAATNEMLAFFRDYIK